ncbi:MAG: hypothetical protein MK168_06490, partial [Candidatus Thalassarchaeum sp.]|nr:hypothetical protein [Candidatus Thalassarchaeum sp.]
GPGTATQTSDGEGSLVRWRIPLNKTPSDLISILWPERLIWDVDVGTENVGPFPAKLGRLG